MKAITLLEPWATLVALGAKRIETRSWATKYRGELAIHASKGCKASHMDIAWKEPFYTALTPIHSYVQGKAGLRYHLGCVIALCRLMDCVKIIGRTSIDGVIVAAQLSNGQEVDGDELAFGDYTPERYAWLLTDARAIPSVPAKGRQGLWEWE